MATKVKRILNPVTGKYYEIRQRSSKYKKGELRGVWDREPKGGKFVNEKRS